MTNEFRSNFHWNNFSFLCPCCHANVLTMLFKMFFIIRNIRTVIYWHHEYFHTVIPMVFYCHCERLPIVIPTILHCHSERQWEISLPSMRFFGNSLPLNNREKWTMLKMTKTLSFRTVHTIIATVPYFLSNGSITIITNFLHFQS